jgi:flagellar hook-basal body complex protein FliE
MSIGQINKYAMNAIKPVKPLNEVAPQPQVQGTGPQSFGEMFTEAIKEVNTMHHEANDKVQDLVMGKEANPHDAMIALEKADAAFQLMNQVRSKIIRAYEDVLRTQV